MAKRRARKQVPKKLTGKTFLIDPKIADGSPKAVIERIEAEGGSVAVHVGAGLSYLVLDPSRKKGGRSKPEREVAKANASGESIEVIDLDELVAMTLPTPEQAEVLLKGSPEDRERLSSVQPPWGCDEHLVLTGVDLRKLDLSGLSLSGIDLVDADLRGANLQGTYFGAWQRVRLDGANLLGVDVKRIRECSFDGMKLTGIHFHEIHDCSFRNADLSKTSNSCGVEARRCRFDGADLFGSYLRFETLEDVRFREARFVQSGFARATLSGADLSAADLTYANFEKANLSESNLARATLTKGHLVEADLRKADLSGANLRYANLASVDLRGAKLDGANFTGANLHRAKRNKRVPKSAMGLAEAEAPPVAGKHVRELEKLCKQNGWVEATIGILEPDGIEVYLTFISYQNGTYFNGNEQSRVGGRYGRSIEYSSVAEALHGLVCKFRDGELLVDSSHATCDNQHDDIARRTALEAWCEVMGLPSPTDEDIANAKQKRIEREKARNADWIVRLKSESGAASLWMELPETERNGFTFSDSDLCGADLHGIDLRGLVCKRADFNGANLEKANLRVCKLLGANLAGANLREVDLYWTDCTKADFSGADLSGADLGNANLREANLRGAKLKGANLKEANLRLADLTGANLDGADLRGARFDEKTKLPKPIPETRQMKWMGKGLPPRPKQRAKKVEQLDFDEFMNRLAKMTESRRLTKAIKMLKAERFQLFSEVTDTSVVGIVSSQTSKGLLYACRLDAAGEYTCCTQNLRACGGLGGQPCKHLLVLLIGLAKSDALDPGKAHRWLTSATEGLPRLDKDALSEVFLKYKGAEAGEIDWRPTETIPEDFYAL